jgi:hypothetical protein
MRVYWWVDRVLQAIRWVYWWPGGFTDGRVEFTNGQVVYWRPDGILLVTRRLYKRSGGFTDGQTGSYWWPGGFTGGQAGLLMARRVY